MVEHFYSDDDMKKSKIIAVLTTVSFGGTINQPITNF